MKGSETPGIVLLGGSFNPAHIGHFRIAIEAGEALRPERVVFIPCGLPPHKEPGALLPFDLRVEMLRAGIADCDGMAESQSECPGYADSHVDLCAVSHAVSRAPMDVCLEEGRRPGPSYTVDTLEALREIYPGRRLCFVLGAEDLPGMSSWRQWRRLPELADLLFLPRRGGACFFAAVKELWPDARPVATPYPALGAAFRLSAGGRLFYLPQPSLDISSSLVRSRFIMGHSLDFLVPQGVQRLLHRHATTAFALWRNSATGSEPENFEGGQ